MASQQPKAVPPVEICSVKMETESFDQDKMERKDAKLVSELAQAEEKPVKQASEFENKDESESEWAKPDDRCLSEMFEPLTLKHLSEMFEPLSMKTRAVSADRPEKSMDCAVSTAGSEKSAEIAVSTDKSEKSMEGAVSTYRPKSPEGEDVEKSALINVTVSLNPKYLIQDSGEEKDASFNKLESIREEGATNYVACSNVENGQHEVEKDDGENGQHQIDEVTKDIKKQKKAKVSKPNCARASCQNKGRHKCSRCKAVFYCHQDCLTEDWSHHKMFCDYVYEANKVPDDSTRKNTSEIENTGDGDEVD